MNFFNKRKVNDDADALHNIKRHLDEINRVYADPENAYRDMDIGICHDTLSLNIVSSYYVKASMLARFTKDVRDMRAVIEGNGDYWGQYQVNYKECQDRLESANLKLQLEKDIYLKLYEKTRELESKLYLAERELEILKGEVK
jgi:hypothetical protein